MPLFLILNLLRSGKKQGKKVTGWFCNYVPEEIIHAAGMLPIRVTADSKELTLGHADAYIYSGACSFTRSCFELALTQQFDFLDGCVSSTCCTNIFRMGEIWSYYINNIPVIYMLDVPRKHTQAHGYEYYKEEVLEFKQRAEQFARVQISDNALRESIRIYNKTRELLKRLYELRKADNPPISGAEVLEATNAAVRMPKEECNKLLEGNKPETAKIAEEHPTNVERLHIK